MSVHGKLAVLGRGGDILNALPLVRHLANGAKCQVVVSEPFAKILECTSYAESVVFKGDYSRLTDAMRDHPDAKVAQYYMHPDSQRTTDSYQREAWRLAGCGDKFGTLPLVLDRRNAEREKRLLDASIVDKQRPYLLVALDGISSPYHRRTELMAAIVQRFRVTHEIMDASKVKAENPVDLLALIENAAVLITVDSLYLHLARASQTPTVCLLQDGFFGSVPPPCCVASKRYAECKLTVEPVLNAITKVLQPRMGAVHHLVQPYGGTDRHIKAQASWRSSYSKGMVACHINAVQRTSKVIGCSRELPFLKDMLRQCMARASEKDVIVWTNSDVELTEAVVPWAKKVVATFGAVSMRRDEQGHCGRDLFAFHMEWLRENWSEMPDYICGASDFDLGLAAMIRMKRGIVSTRENLAYDFPPCDSPERLYHHEPHVGAWTQDPRSPSNSFNRKLFVAWAKKHAPRIKFTNDGVIA